MLLAFCGALAVLDAERASSDANITTFEDACWWAISTMTTVGYGDRFPTTGTGRLAAVALMIGGIAFLGVVTAALASWLVEQVTAAEEQQTVTLRAEIHRLTNPKWPGWPGNRNPRTTGAISAEDEYDFVYFMLEAV